MNEPIPITCAECTYWFKFDPNHRSALSSFGMCSNETAQALFAAADSTLLPITKDSDNCARIAQRIIKPETRKPVPEEAL